MLLGAIGLVAIAGSSSGTFASFNAEVTNSGNYFASGTLILNDNGGQNTCTSVGTSNSNLNTGNGCDTLFQLNKLATPTGSLSTGLTNGTPATELDFGGSGLAGGAISAGDTLTVISGTNSHTFTATETALVGAAVVTVTSSDPGFDYPTGSTVTDSASTQFAQLQLTNAGSLDASDIKASMPSDCGSAAAEGTGTLAAPLTLGTAPTTITFSALTGGGINTGDPVVVSDGSHFQTFISTQTVASGATSVTVATQPANFSYTTSATVGGPSLGTGSLCTALTLSIIETDATYDIGYNSAPAAEGCASGTAQITYPALGCVLDSGPTLHAFFLAGSNPLTLTSGILSNTGTNLSAGKSRYFLIAVREPVGALTDNTFQNRKASFDLTWHIDQA
jgi:hypothetical protein